MHRVRKLHTLSVEAIVFALNTHHLPSYGPAFPIHFMLQAFSFFIALTVFSQVFEHTYIYTLNTPARLIMNELCGSMAGF